MLDNNETNKDQKTGIDQICPKDDSENSKIETKTITELQDELLSTKLDAAKNFEQMLRAKAELENYKKRVARQMNDLKKYALESTMKELLNIIDNLERAIKSSENDKKNIKSLVEGINLTLIEMLKILKVHNVTQIKSIGEIFDPTIHQAMSQEETLDQPSNVIIKEFLKGYLIHDRLLRPAMVVVSKKPKQEKA